MRGDDSAFREGRGCYTTARICGGRPRFAKRHAQRLGRDAAALGLGEVDERAATRALEALGAAAFANRDGVVRLQASRDGDGRLHLVGVPREIGDEPAAWAAIVADFPHAGPGPYAGRKVTNHLLFALAADAARDAGVQEALLFDGEGRLVEGARSNLFVVSSSGRLSTPPLERGGVAGIAREVVLERVGEAESRDISRAELRSARELVAVNAVRGARPVTRLDGEPVGTAQPGPWAARLAQALAED
ncbi:MAG: aminotransferase class IV [Myxococcota bacterium]